MSDFDGCWPWTAATNVNGYGWFRLDGESVLAHRLAWEMYNGPIPDRMTIDHLCFLRTCCRVAHMEVVTRGENSRRGSVRFGEMGRGGPESGCDMCKRPIPEDRAGRKRCSAICDKIANSRRASNRYRTQPGSGSPVRGA